MTRNGQKLAKRKSCQFFKSPDFRWRFSKRCLWCFSSHSCLLPDEFSFRCQKSQVLMTSHDKPSTRGFVCINDLGYEDQACKEVKMLLKNNFNPLHRGAFGKFPFQWIYYYGSNKSTRKETGKTPLCAMWHKMT